MNKILHAIALVAILSIGAFAQPAQNVVTMQNAATSVGNGTAIKTASQTTNAMFGAVGFQVTGTFSATITFEVTFDGSTWVEVMATNLSDDTRATTATAAGAYSVLLNGALQCRARISAYTSGSVTVKGRLIPGLVSRVIQAGGGGGGSGDVVGAASSTDNAIARFNGTGGKTIQNSVVTVGDTGDVAGIAALTFTGVLTGGSAPTTITDSAGKILSAALNTVQPAQGGTGITSLGTGIAAALGVNVGSAGAPVLFNGAGGTPSSITLTNATGLPLSSGVTGDLPFANFVQAGSAGFVGATGAGDYSHRTPTQVTAALDAFVGDSGSGGAKGLVPAPASGDATKYLKGDGTWAAVSGSGDVVGPSSSVDNELPRFDSTTGKLIQASGVTLSDLASNAYTFTASTPTQGASAIAGSGLSLTASPAVAGNTNAGAAAGGSITITAGNAAQLTSGNAKGGDINLVTGTGIGTGTAGQVLIPDGVLAAPAISFSSSTNTGIHKSGASLIIGIGGTQLVDISNGDYRFRGTTAIVTWGDTGSSPSLRNMSDGGLRLAAGAGAGNLLIGTSAGAIGTSGAGVLAMTLSTAPTTSPTDTAQIWATDMQGTAGNAGFHMRNEINTASLVIAGVRIKTDTGDPTDLFEGMIVINTFDNTAKIYADGALRTIATW